jgi:hypothetical protein
MIIRNGAARGPSPKSLSVSPPAGHGPLQLTFFIPSAIRLPLGYWFMRMPPT